LAKINDNDIEPERYYDWIGWKLRQERKQRMKNGKLDYHKDMEDMVNHPPHYNQAGIEALDAILAATNEGSEYYLQGNILKYVWRYRYKNGSEDLEKALFYLEKMIKVVKKLEENDNVNIK